MRSIEFNPSPPLRPYVQLIWGLELDPGDRQLAAPERIAPDGIVELVLHYRRPLELRFAGDAFAVPPRSSLISQTRRFVDIAAPGGTGLVSVRFRPWGAHHFLAPPVSAVADRLTPAAELWGRDIDALEERLESARDMRARVGVVERFLLAQLARHQRADLEGLVRALWRSTDQVPVAEFCRQAGLTERTLERTCAAALGMSPRSYQRLVRFLHACALLRRGGWHSLTDVGYRCGYFDQAHFAHDFKAFAGLTPRQFLGTPAFSFLQID